MKQRPTNRSAATYAVGAGLVLLLLSALPSAYASMAEHSLTDPVVSATDSGERAFAWTVLAADPEDESPVTVSIETCMPANSGGMSSGSGFRYTWPAVVPGSAVTLTFPDGTQQGAAAPWLVTTSDGAVSGGSTVGPVCASRPESSEGSRATGIRAADVEPELGTIRVMKTTIGEPVGSNEPFTFTGDLSGTLGVLDLPLSRDVPAGGPYEVTEVLSVAQAAAGWSLRDIVCDDTDSTSDGSTAVFMVSANEVVTCVFTNVFARPAEDDNSGGIMIELATSIKSSERFAFAGVDGFDLDLSLRGGQRSPLLAVDPGTYRVQEVLTEEQREQGWEIADVSCLEDQFEGEKNSSGDVTSGTATLVVEPDEIVLCTFTNEFDQVLGKKIDEEEPPDDDDETEVRGLDRPSVLPLTGAGTGVQHLVGLALFLLYAGAPLARFHKRGRPGNL